MKCQSCLNDVINDLVNDSRGNTYAQRIPLRTMNVTATSDAAEMRQRESERRSYIRKRVLPNIDGRVRLTTSVNGKTTELSRPAMSPDPVTPDARHLAARARARKRLSGLYSSNKVRLIKESNY